MQRKRRLAAWAAAVAALAFTGSAFAQGDNVPQDKRWYIAPMLSYGFMDHDQFSFFSPGTGFGPEECIAAGGIAYESDGGCDLPNGEWRTWEEGTSSERHDLKAENKDSFGVSLAIGKPINSWLNLEGYGFYFRPDQRFSFEGGETYSGHGRIWGIGAEALLFPARDTFPIFGIVGASWGKMKATSFSGSPVGDVGGSANAHFLDLGVGYLHNLNDYGLKLRAEYRHRYASVESDDWFESDLNAHKGHFNSNIISVGLQIPLGAPPAAPVTEPAPQPAPPPATETITLKADALFAFDRGDLAGMLDQGRAELDELAAKINASYTRIDSIELEGHTDRLGPEAYNQRLSQERADTVMHYLQSQGVSVPMTAIGVGERNPVTTGCVGHVATKELIACLQPNRRVEVNISGIRRK